MRFEVGKFYRHSGNAAPLHILCEVPVSTAYFAPTLLAEDTEGEWQPVGTDETSAENWTEIPSTEYYAVWYAANPDSDELRRLAGE